MSQIGILAVLLNFGGKIRRRKLKLLNLKRKEKKKMFVLGLMLGAMLGIFLMCILMSGKN